MRGDRDSNLKLGKGSRLFLILYYAAAALVLLPWPFLDSSGIGIYFQLFRFVGGILLFPLCIVLPPLYCRRGCQRESVWPLAKFWLLVELCVVGLLYISILSFLDLFPKAGFSSVVSGMLGAPVLLLDALVLQLSALVAYFREKRKNPQYPAPPESAG